MGDDPAYVEVNLTLQIVDFISLYELSFNCTPVLFPCIKAHLSEQQMETLCSHRRSLMEKKQADLQDRYRRALQDAEDGEGSCPKRDVTPVWRLCIADSTDQPGSGVSLFLFILDVLLLL